MSTSTSATDYKDTESKSAHIEEINDNADDVSSDDDDVPALEEGESGGVAALDDSKQNRQEKKARKAISKMGVYSI